MLPILLIAYLLITIAATYRSQISISFVRMEFQPTYSVQLLATTIAQTLLTCCATCNRLPACRSFDFDSVSKRCRLFEGDATTGSVVSSSSSTSVVGSVVISSVLFSSIHNQACEACVEDRYETCVGNSSVCQCPSHTYWDGSVCALQLFANSTCLQGDACRSDLDLTCAQECYGQFTRCVSTTVANPTGVPAMRFGVTIAGGCNGSSSTNQTTLLLQADITIDANNTIYVGDNGNRLLRFDQNNRTARLLRTFATWPAFVFYDNRTSWVYVTVMTSHLLYIWPTNQTIPPNGISYGNCSLNWLYYPSGIVVDSVGNAYISCYYCNWVTEWAPNATSGTLVAGQASAMGGSDSLSLYAPYNLALDEVNSFIYVVERFNYRVSRFVLGGSGVGVVVAGGNGPGSNTNQLYRPTDIYLSKSRTEIYIADCANNRVQKWQINATTGTTVAGSPNGTADNSPYLMNSAYGLAVDSDETFLYVSDSINNRIQHFSLR